LHGEAYRGHVFWDELFIFPVLNLRLPTVTRSLLRYRYRRLLEAAEPQSWPGTAGAMYPWQSGTDGREESQSCILIRDPGGGERIPASCPSHRHRRRVQRVEVLPGHRRFGFLIDYGAEMLAEIARFWVSRTTYDPERDRTPSTVSSGPTNSIAATRIGRTRA